MRKQSTTEDKIQARLERITWLLEDLFILEASRIGMKKEPLREILGIDKRRIGRIAKHVKEQE
jgi:hypothetical protein